MSFTPIAERVDLDRERRGNWVDDPEVFDLIDGDRTVRGARYQTILSEYRPATAQKTMAPYAAGAAADASAEVWRVLVYGATARMPTPLPGSANVAVTNSGGTAATRGELQFRAQLSAAECVLRVRKATLAGTYGQSTTFGAASYAVLQRATASLGWVGTTILLPTGVAPGDDLDLMIAWRQYVDATAASIGGWLVAEPVLTSVGP